MAGPALKGANTLKWTEVEFLEIITVAATASSSLESRGQAFLPAGTRYPTQRVHYFSQPLKENQSLLRTFPYPWHDLVCNYSDIDYFQTPTDSRSKA